MNATLREIVLAVRYGDASLVGESVGYLILGACDRALAVPRLADVDGILVTGEGDVVLDATVAGEQEAERSLRYLLAQLLTLVRTPFPNLARVAAREPCGLGHLVTELEAALVPVNRRAAKRSLSRLVRETRRSQAREHQHAAVADVDPPREPAGPVVRAEVASPAWSPATLPEISWSKATLPELPLPAQYQPSQPPPTQPEPSWPEPTASADPAGWEWEVDEVPSLLAEPVTLVPAQASGVWSSPGRAGSAAQPEALSDDEFDHALTRVTSAVETLPAPEPERRSSFNMRRLVPAPALEGPLLPGPTSTSPTPSSIEDLLHRLRVEGEPAEVVLADLARLARLDLSPATPPVG